MALFESYEEERNRFWLSLLSTESTPSKKLQKLQKLLALMYTNDRRHSANLLRECKMGLHCRRSNRIKKGCRKASEAAAAIGEGLQSFCIPGSVADQRKVGLGHGNLG